jgi:hypothetical protein
MLAVRTRARWMAPRRKGQPAQNCTGTVSRAAASRAPFACGHASEATRTAADSGQATSALLRQLAASRACTASVPRSGSPVIVAGRAR